MTAGNPALIESVFAGDSEVAACMGSLDWSATHLGVVDQWPQALRRVVLGTVSPIAIVWGPNYVLLYNDAYRPIAGKHPWALGRGAHEVYPEAWDFMGPIYDSVMHRGQAIITPSDVMVPLNRNNRLEEFYFAYTASPIPDDTGRVGGLLSIWAEAPPGGGASSYVGLPVATLGNP